MSGDYEPIIGWRFPTEDELTEFTRQRVLELLNDLTAPTYVVRMARALIAGDRWRGQFGTPLERGAVKREANALAKITVLLEEYQRDLTRFAMEEVDEEGEETGDE